MEDLEHKISELEKRIQILEEAVMDTVLRIEEVKTKGLYQDITQKIFKEQDLNK